MLNEIQNFKPAVHIKHCCCREGCRLESSLDFFEENDTFRKFLESDENQLWIIFFKLVHNYSKEFDTFRHDNINETEIGLKVIMSTNDSDDNTWPHSTPILIVGEKLLIYN